MTNSTQKSKRKRTKFSGNAKITLAAVSMIGFVGGWNLIARLEHEEAQANEPQPFNPEPVLQPASLAPTSTPWPAIPPLPELSPIPKLRPTLTTAQLGDTLTPSQQGDTLKPLLDPVAVQVAPLPTLAPPPPLAPLPPLPEPPPPPPPAPAWNGGGGNHSGGS